MRLDWNDIRARAAKFAEDWKHAHYERGESQTFYNEFFELFGVTRRRVASFEHGVDLPEKKRGYLDLFWKGKLLIEQKSAGRDLKPARKQALDYFPGLKEHELPRYILLSDFQTFELYDLDIDPDKPVRFRLSELAEHIQNFGFIVGQERRIFRDQDPANILASEMMGALHDALEESGYRGHALERFLVRLRGREAAVGADEGLALSHHLSADDELAARGRSRATALRVRDGARAAGGGVIRVLL